MVIELPPMGERQTASWEALIELHRLVPRHWTLVGGQMVHLHCFERGAHPPRPTDDADAVLDVRSRSDIHPHLTSQLKELGFHVESTSMNGKQHRWANEAGAVIDVLIPRGLRESVALRKGAGGAPTIETPGAQKVLNRSESVRVTLRGRTGQVNRPTLLGGLIAKAAAHTVHADEKRIRHVEDFVLLASLAKPSDFTNGLDKREYRYLSRMGAVLQDQPRIVGTTPGGDNGVRLLERALARGPRVRSTV